MRGSVAGVAAAVAVAVAGCGRSGDAPKGSATARSSPPATLAPDAVPYLPSSVRTVTEHGLAREFQAPALASELRGWGYVSGSSRYFQGESRRLQVVDSRTLRFRSPRGASAFVGFVRVHTGPYLGSFAQVHGFASRGRRGILAVGQPCQCHLANPALLGVVSRGATVTWLLINGPGATVRRLAALLSRAP